MNSPPIDRVVPVIVGTWEASEQLAWFRHFANDLKAQSGEHWDQFFCESDQHRGRCCDPCCIGDRQGLDPTICCCLSPKETDGNHG